MPTRPWTGQGQWPFRLGLRESISLLRGPPNPRLNPPLPRPNRSFSKIPLPRSRPQPLRRPRRNSPRRRRRPRQLRAKARGRLSASNKRSIPRKRYPAPKTAPMPSGSHGRSAAGPPQAHVTLPRRVRSRPYRAVRMWPRRCSGLQLPWPALQCVCRPPGRRTARGSRCRTSTSTLTRSGLTPSRPQRFAPSTPALMRAPLMRPGSPQPASTSSSEDAHRRHRRYALS